MAILQTLQRTNWNKQEAAQILGLYRPTLYSKMKKHDIQDQRAAAARGRRRSSGSRLGASLKPPLKLATRPSSGPTVAQRMGHGRTRRRAPSSPPSPGSARCRSSACARFARRSARPTSSAKSPATSSRSGGARRRSIATAGLAIGVVLSMHTRASLERFGAEAMIPAGLAIALIRETGPLVTALLVVGPRRRRALAPSWAP